MTSIIGTKIRVKRRANIKENSLATKQSPYNQRANAIIMIALDGWSLETL